MAKTIRKENLYTFYYREPLYPHYPIVFDIKITSYPRKCGAWRKLQKMFNDREAHSIGFTTNDVLY